MEGIVWFVLGVVVGIIVGLGIGKFHRFLDRMAKEDDKCIDREIRPYACKN
jgi:hypothetical protein